jgi:hypothetical protein
MLSRVAVVVYWTSVAAAIALLLGGISMLIKGDEWLTSSWFVILAWVLWAAAIYVFGWLFRFLFGPDRRRLDINFDL